MLRLAKREPYNSPSRGALRFALRPIPGLVRVEVALSREGPARLDPRIAVTLRVDIEYPARSEMWARAESLDLSASGLYLRCAIALPLKAQVGCRIFLPPAGGHEDFLVDSQAVVVRVDNPSAGSKEWRYGLYFVDIQDGDLQAIRRYVFATR